MQAICDDFYVVYVTMRQDVCKPVYIEVVSSLWPPGAHSVMRSASCRWGSHCLGLIVLVG